MTNNSWNGIKHYEYLADPTTDFFVVFAQEFLKVINQSNARAYVAYNSTFEKNCLRTVVKYLQKLGRPASE